MLMRISTDSASNIPLRTSSGSIVSSKSFAPITRDHFTRASTLAVAGTYDEAVQVSGPGAAFSLSLRDHYLTLPTRATSLPPGVYREMMKRRFAAWEEVVVAQAAA